jgi:hypothetical protein
MRCLSAVAGSGEEGEMDTLILKTGAGQFDLLNPRVEDVNIDDMLRNLSRIVRFNGASPFTVLQHSLYVGRLLRAQGESRDVILRLCSRPARYITGDIAAPILDRLLLGVAWWGDNWRDVQPFRFTELGANAQWVVEQAIGCEPSEEWTFDQLEAADKAIRDADLASREFETTYDYLNVPELARDIVNMTPFACIEAFKAELADLGVVL